MPWLMGLRSFNIKNHYLSAITNPKISNRKKMLNNHHPQFGPPSPFSNNYIHQSQLFKVKPQLKNPIFTKLDKKIKQKTLNKVFEGLGIQTPQI
jgi:hypothetical protein